MTTDLGKTRARDIGSGKVPENAVSVTATALNPTAPAALTAANPTAPAALTQVAAPAGGGGATAGAYDSAANRDLMIASINAGRTDLIALRAEVVLYEIEISALVADAVAARTEQLTYETAISALIADVDAMRTELVAMNIMAA